MLEKMLTEGKLDGNEPITHCSGEEVRRCPVCGEKIDLEDGIYRVDTATGKIYCVDCFENGR